MRRIASERRLVAVCVTLLGMSSCAFAQPPSDPPTDPQPTRAGAAMAKPFIKPLPVTTSGGTGPAKPGKNKHETGDHEKASEKSKLLAARKPASELNAHRREEIQKERVKAAGG